MTDQSLVLADGRRLGFATFGDSDGRPAIYAHGFPACRLEAELLGPDFSAAEIACRGTGKLLLNENFNQRHADPHRRCEN